MMKEIISTAVSKAMTYAEYNLLFKQLVAEARSTGEQTQEKIDYTKLNYSRTKRLDKTAHIPEKEAVTFRNFKKKQTWLVICEPWCGDAAQSLPYLNKFAQLSDKIDLKIVLRDDNPDLMNGFLTNGSQSIPILIVLDDDLNVLKTWGPRSTNASQMVADYKREHGVIDDNFKESLQVWYNKDKGASIINDLVASL